MRVNLTGGAYQNASVIAAAQRCMNLFPEINPAAAGESAKVTHYPTPGLRTFGTALPGGSVRALYTASTGELYAVAGRGVYLIGPLGTSTRLGSLVTPQGPVSMQDNTLSLVVVDGSARGENPTSFAGGMNVNLFDRTVAPMPTEAQGFYGADRVDYLGTFLVFNKPGTPQFYASDSLGVTFDPLNFANKSGAPDYLSACVVVRGQVVLLGQRNTEVWSLSGASDFPFQQIQGAAIEHGTNATASVVRMDGSVFFLSADAQGWNIVVKLTGYQTARISTHALEAMLDGVDATAARGFAYQYRGHSFYVLCLATATWAYDLATEQWHQWSSQVDGVDAPHRACCFATAYGKMIVGDRETGQLYEVRGDVGTDNGVPIRRVRSFPHMIHEGNRIHYRRLIADMDVAPAVPADVTLRYSNDRGRTFGNPVRQTLGTTPNTSVQFRRLGMARDRVFELSWDSPSPLALNGAFIDVDEAET